MIYVHYYLSKIKTFLNSRIHLASRVLEEIVNVYKKIQVKDF